SIPQKINGNYYEIILNNDGLFINILPDGRKVSDKLYALTHNQNIEIRESRIVSVSRKAMIHKHGNEIWINSINI
ncbi:MAG: hypothetical protein GXO64_04945, partial [Candidatus Micrarchaeota archaeon]|nr:hypothetical protein [Candidatus Micrarchaeota archaeon]